MSTPTRLPPLVIIIASLKRIVQRRAALLQGLFLPTLLLAFINGLSDWNVPADTLLQSEDPEVRKAALMAALPILGLGLAEIVLRSVFAVSAFRILLLQKPPTIEHGGLVWTKREWRFLGATVNIVLLASFASMLSSALPASLLTAALPEQWSEARTAIGVLCQIPGAIVFCRLATVLPTVATDCPISLSQAWQLTIGTGWRLSVIVLALPVVLLSFAALQLWNATPPLSSTASVLLLVLVQLCTLLGIAGLSVAFHQLSKNGGH